MNNTQITVIFILGCSAFLFMDIQYRLSEEIVEVSTGLNSEFCVHVDQIAVNKENPLQRSSSINSQQVRKEVERVLKPYNTTSYYLLVCYT